MAEKATYSVSAREIVQKKQIETLFQPIVAVEDGSIYGFEALARGPKFSQYAWRAASRSALRAS